MSCLEKEEIFMDYIQKYVLKKTETVNSVY